MAVQATVHHPLAVSLAMQLDAHMREVEAKNREIRSTEKKLERAEDPLDSSGSLVAICNIQEHSSPSSRNQGSSMYRNSDEGELVCWIIQ